IKDAGAFQAKRWRFENAIRGQVCLDDRTISICNDHALVRTAQAAERFLDTFALGEIIASGVFFHLVSTAVSTNRIRPANLSWRHCELPKCRCNTLVQDKLGG